MNAKTGTCLLIVAQCFAGVASFAVESVYSPVANVTEKFTNNALWTVKGAGTLAVVDQSLRWSCTSQSIPIPRIGVINANGTSSAGHFVGNYVNSAITDASFDVKRIGVSSDGLLRFSSTNGHLWYCSFPAPSQDGVWEHREIPMTYSEEWKCDDITNNFAQSFEIDRTQVKEIGIQSLALGTASQELKIDNFKVLGPWEKGPLTTDEMPLYWLTENGIPAQAGQAGLDKDGDGFNNFAEYMAGTDPSDANSQFKISITVGADGKPVLTWTRANYRSYTVFKSSDLSVTDSFVTANGAIQAVGQQNQMTVGDQTDGPGFYRVKVDKAQ